MNFARRSFQQETMTITPEVAEEMLKTNTNNFRQINVDRVNSYADQITAGKWHLGADAIKFVKDGTLADGQHTLSAVIKASKPIEAVVFYGLDDSTVLAVDTGCPRKGADIFRHLGIKFAAGTTATLQCIRYVLGEVGPSKRTIAPQMLYELWYNTYKTAVEWAVDRVYMRRNPCRNQSVAAALALAYRRGTMAKMEEFATQLVTGENLPTGSPALAVRNYFINRGANSTCAADDSRTRALKVLGAAAAFVQGKPMPKLYVGAGIEAIEFFLKDEEVVEKAVKAAQEAA